MLGAAPAPASPSAKLRLGVSRLAQAHHTVHPTISGLLGVVLGGLLDASRDRRLHLVKVVGDVPVLEARHDRHLELGLLVHGLGEVGLLGGRAGPVAHHVLGLGLDALHESNLVLVPAGGGASLHACVAVGHEALAHGIALLDVGIVMVLGSISLLLGLGGPLGGSDGSGGSGLSVVSGLLHGGGGSSAALVLGVSLVGHLGLVGLLLLARLGQLVGSGGLGAELLPLGRRLEARFLGVQTSGTLLCVLLVHRVHGSLGLDASVGESSLELVALGARGELGLSLGDGNVEIPEVGGVLHRKLGLAGLVLTVDRAALGGGLGLLVGPLPLDPLGELLVRLDLVTNVLHALVVSAQTSHGNLISRLAPRLRGSDLIVEELGCLLLLREHLPLGCSNAGKGLHHAALGLHHVHVVTGVGAHGAVLGLVLLATEVLVLPGLALGEGSHGLHNRSLEGSDSAVLQGVDSGVHGGLVGHDLVLQRLVERLGLGVFSRLSRSGSRVGLLQVAGR